MRSEDRNGGPTEIRTPVSGVRGRRPRPLDDGTRTTIHYQNLVENANKKWQGASAEARRSNKIGLGALANNTRRANNETAKLNCSGFGMIIFLPYFFIPGCERRGGGRSEPL